MAIEIVSFPINSTMDLSIVFCKRLPEGRGKNTSAGVHHPRFAIIDRIKCFANHFPSSKIREQNVFPRFYVL